MVVAALLATVILNQFQIDHLLDRPLTWESGGIVRVKETQKISAQEQAWLGDMRKGDYNKVLMDAIFQTKKSPASFFQIWIISESCRKKNSLGEFRKFVADYEKAYGKSRQSYFAQLKLLSLSYAVAIKSNDQVASEGIKEKIHAIARESEGFLTDCLPLSLAVASLPIGETTKRRSIAERLVRDNPSVTDLKLWQVRAFLNGAISSPLGSDGKVLKQRNGRPIVRLGSDGPDLEKAQECLESYAKAVPTDPRAKFYQARLLSMKAYFLASDEKETVRLTQQAQKHIDAFLASPGMPKPMIDIGRRFKSAPYPGTFITLQSE